MALESGNDHLKYQDWHPERPVASLYEMPELFEIEGGARNIESELREAEVASQAELEGGANLVKFVTLENNLQAIFKPRSGEKPTEREAFEAGTYYLRERAAFLVSDALELNLVPPTVVREIDGQIGSLQMFIPEAITGAEAYIAPNDFALQDELCKLWLFDYAIWNTDRNGGNVLIKNKKVTAIDHGLSLSKANPRVYMDFYGQDIPDELRQNYFNFAEDQSKHQQLFESITEYISEDEAEACLARILHLSQLLTQVDAIEDRRWLGYSPRLKPQRLAA